MEARRILLIPPVLENICCYLSLEAAINFREALELTHLRYSFGVIKLAEPGEYWEKKFDQLIFPGINDCTLKLYRLLSKYGFNRTLKKIIYQESIPALNFLLKVDYNIEVFARYFILIAKRGITHLLPIFLKYGPDNLINAVWKGSKSALHQAANNNRLETVQFLLENNAEIDAVDDYDRTALTLAAEKGYYEMVKLLLDTGADPNWQSFEYNGIGEYTPLVIAARKNHVKIVKLLLATGKIKECWIDLALVLSSKEGNLETAFSETVFSETAFSETVTLLYHH